jgi:hypothetical protein
MGPCVGRADRDEYMALVHRVIDYVDGRDQALHDVLWQGLEDAAAALDFERASRLRRELHASLSLTSVQRRLRESTEANWGVLVTPSPEEGAREIMLILRGRIWSQTRFADQSGPAGLAARLERSWHRYLSTGLRDPDHDSVDDMHILGSWLSRNDGYPGMIPIDRFAEVQDWLSVSERALALSRDQLDFDAWRRARDAGESVWDSDSVLEMEDAVAVD